MSRTVVMSQTVLCCIVSSRRVLSDVVLVPFDCVGLVVSCRLVLILSLLSLSCLTIWSYLSSFLLFDLPICLACRCLLSLSDLSILLYSFLVTSLPFCLVGLFSLVLFLPFLRFARLFFGFVGLVSSRYSALSFSCNALLAYYLPSIKLKQAKEVNIDQNKVVVTTMRGEMIRDRQ
jgi:hypothetical protein